jgi:hypothetical protein
MIGSFEPFDLNVVKLTSLSFDYGNMMYLKAGILTLGTRF